MSVTDPTEPSLPQRRGRAGWTGPRRPRRRRRRPSRRADPAVPRHPRRRRAEQHGPSLLAADVAEVGIERPDGPVVHALLAPGSSSSSSHPPAQEPAQPLRSPGTTTTGSIPTSWPTWSAPTGAGCARCLSTPATTALRQTVRARRDLVAHRAAAPTSCALTCRSVPRRVALFADIDSDISLRFQERLATADRAACSRQAWLAAQIAAQVAEQLQLHPDAPIFTSLPRSTACAPPAARRDRDALRRSPPPTRCLPGRRRSLDPSVQQGRGRQLPLGADRQLRDALCDFAGDSRHANPCC